jgi:hypothetical protein
MGQKLRGLVGQRMAPKSLGARVALFSHKAPGSGTITTPAFPCIAEFWLWGGGGGGASGGQGAGSGAGAVHFRLRVSPIQVVQYTVGAAGAAGSKGGDTFVTNPVGQELGRAFGGNTTMSDAGALGVSGACALPGALIRKGGDGGGAGGSPSSASDGDHGGTGGGVGGGGGGAGFSDFGDLIGGNGAVNTTPGTIPGSGGTHSTGSGCDGVLYATFTRLLNS